MKATNAKLNVSLVASHQEVAQEILELFVSSASKVIKQSGRFCVGISRHTPGNFFDLLASEPRAKSLPWTKIHLFCMDRCCGSSGCNQEYDCPACPVLMSTVRIPGENVHCICSNCRSCTAAASAYELTIRRIVRHNGKQVPQFDLILLPLESDGHVASLFPDTFAFFECERLACAIHFMDNRHTRITMTHPVLCAASHVAVLVSGREKAVLLRELFTSELNIVRYPIHALWPILDKVTWLVDQDAARFLSEPTCRNGVSQ